MLKIMLLIPPGGYLAERWSHGELLPALGIGYIAAVLEQAGHKVCILDPNAENLKKNGVLARIKEFDPELVGITLTTENRFQAFKIGQEIKKSFPDIKIVLGGPHVWRTADDTLRHLNYIDYAVRGEGELTTLELVESLTSGKDIGRVAGLSYRKDDGSIVHNPERSMIENLDEMPFAARHLYPMDQYSYFVEDPVKGRRRALNLITSRGCPFHCNFCATPSNWGRKVRYLSAENVVKEVELLIHTYHAEALYFFDDTFTFNPQRVHDICDGFIGKKFNISWYCEIRIDTVTKDLLRKMRDAGCCFVGMGIESASPRVLNEVINKGKGFTIDKVTEVIKNCLDFAMIPNPYFIISHPTETYMEALQTMDYIKFLKNLDARIDISISIMHIYPGTPLEKWALEKGILQKEFSWSLPNQKGVITLPAAQGEVPLFVDKLTWKQISQLLFEWSQYKEYSIISKIPKVLKSIKSYQDFKRYFIMGIEYLRKKIGM